MLVIHRGGGMLVPIYGILSALFTNVLFYKVMGHSDYYDEHLWPKLGVLILAGGLCLITGLVLKRKRARDAHWEREYLDSLSPRSASANELVFSGPRDHLMFIPLQYWSLAYFGAAALYGILASMKG